MPPKKKSPDLVSKSGVQTTLPWQLRSDSTEIDKMKMEELKKLFDDLRSDLKSDNEEVKSQLDSIQSNLKSITSEISSITEGLTTVTEKCDKNEKEIETLKKQVKSIAEDLVAERREGLRREIHARKRNLLFYGIKETKAKESPHETEEVLRKVLLEEMKLGSSFVEGLTFQAVHRVKRLSITESNPPPLGIIAAFYSSEEVYTVMGSLKNLKGTRISVRTDLPVILKKRRRTLASDAYKLRQEGYQTRIIVRDVTVVLQARKPPAIHWDDVSD